MMRKLLAAVALATLAACSESSVTSTTTASIAGTYSLQSVNGVAVPFVVSTNPTVELRSEQLVVNGDGTFSISTNKQSTNSIGVVSTEVQSDVGTYTVGGSTGTFHFASGNTASAVFESNRLTLATSTSASVYVK